MIRRPPRSKRTATLFPYTSRFRSVVIRGLEADLGMAKVFDAGTTLRDDGAAITSGGRVLCVVARGADVREAQRQAYAAVEQIRWDGVQYRRDIGYRAIAREE